MRGGGSSAFLPEKTPTMKRNFSFAIVLLLLALGLLALISWRMYQQPSGSPAPDFTLPRLDVAEELSLSDLRGEVVVLNFWGSWCIPCREEAPMLQRLYEENQAQGVVFLGVAVDDTQAKAQAYLEEFSISYPNVIDLRDEMEALYHIYGVPVTVIIDREGYIRRTLFSTPSAEQLQDAINAAL